MGVKALRCFPWYGRRRERRRKKSEEASPEASPIEEKPRLHSTPSVSSDTDSQQRSAYFSEKARVSFRHQMDSPTMANDSTY
ncbi:uncharacterized protein C17orf114 homolog isoform X2 [Spea bombifrons]|nr:uncharacterized protein C17orf114 homolog isoform X2 [Spea bombifrons]